MNIKKCLLIFVITIIFFTSMCNLSLANETDTITISGNGAEMTSSFTLESGLTTFELSHDGSGHFAVWLLDDQGDNVELLANEIGTFHGSKAVGIEETGSYSLEVSADGAWSIAIEEPRPTTAPSVPLTLTGTGQEASQIFYLDNGLTTFELNHDGSGHFGVWLLNDQGDYVELLANEIGTFHGSKAVGIDDPGIYLLDISADGNWEVQIYVDSPHNPYDSNQNCIIEISEISAVVDDFLNGQLSLNKTSELVDYFLSGDEYC